jgi:hypothetical protein
MYLAQGDGTRILESTPMTCQGGYIQWSPDGQALIFRGQKETYVLNIEHQAVEIQPASQNEKFAWPTSTDPCGDAGRFEHQISSSLGKVASACLSPDKALLAVGTQGALKIYDAHLNLLRSISIDGTVHGIAWSPVP